MGKDRRWFRVRAVYPATSLVLIVWGDDQDDAQHRAAWWQKGALHYVVLNETDKPY